MSSPVLSFKCVTPHVVFCLRTNLTAGYSPIYLCLQEPHGPFLLLSHMKRHLLDMTCTRLTEFFVQRQSADPVLLLLVKRFLLTQTAHNSLNKNRCAQLLCPVKRKMMINTQSCKSTAILKYCRFYLQKVLINNHKVV